MCRLESFVDVVSIDSVEEHGATACNVKPLYFSMFLHAAEFFDRPANDEETNHDADIRHGIVCKAFVGKGFKSAEKEDDTGDCVVDHLDALDF